MLDPNDPRIITAIEEGYASGDAGEITPEFWEERRQRLEQLIAMRESINRPTSEC